MNKRFLVSVVVVFAMSMAIGFTVHGLLLAQDYGQLGRLFRTEADQQKHLPFMLLGHVSASLAFVWIYLRGKEDKPALAQGIRYGLAIAALAIVPKFLIYYAVQPMPHMVVLKQMVFDTIGVVLMGIAVASLNK